MDARCVGIDLGTSNTCVSVNTKLKIDVLDLDSERYLMPSVYCRDKRNDGEAVGIVAASRNVNDNFFVVRNSKRFIGVPFSSERVKTNPYLCSADMREGDDGGVVFFKNGNDFTTTPTKVAARILSAAKKRIEQRIGAEAECVTVTYPVGFSSRQLGETKKAIRLAGFKEGTFTLIDEPSASAIAYIAEEHQYDGMLVMFDIGGGTFDVTIVKVCEGHISILNHIGKEDFGGLAIDKKIAEFVDEEWFKIYKLHILGLEGKDALRTYDKFLRKCEEAKRQLTAASYCDIDIELPASVGKCYNIDDPLMITLMQSQVESLIKEDIDSCIQLMEEAILECGMTKDDITAVVLIGGTCRLPFVKTKLEKCFKRNIVKENINPDTAVCVGACHYSIGWMNNKEKPYFTMDGKQLFIDQILKENILLDIGNEELHVVIPRGIQMGKKTFHVCLDTPNTTANKMKVVLYAGNSKRRDKSRMIREISWSGFPVNRNYIVHFVLFVTLLSERCISVRVEDRVNKTVYYPETVIEYSIVCSKQQRNRDIHHSQT